MNILSNNSGADCGRQSQSGVVLACVSRLLPKPEGSAGSPTSLPSCHSPAIARLHSFDTVRAARSPAPRWTCCSHASSPFDQVRSISVFVNRFPDFAYALTRRFRLLRPPLWHRLPVLTAPFSLVTPATGAIFGFGLASRVVFSGRILRS